MVHIRLLHQSMFVGWNQICVAHHIVGPLHGFVEELDIAPVLRRGGGDWDSLGSMSKNCPTSVSHVILLTSPEVGRDRVLALNWQSQEWN